MKTPHTQRGQGEHVIALGKSWGEEKGDLRLSL